MQIHKGPYSDAMMLFLDYITIYFTHYEKHASGINLMDGERIAAMLHLEQATEFYKAWRAMP